MYQLKKHLLYPIVKCRNDGGWAKCFLQKERDLLAVFSDLCCKNSATHVQQVTLLQKYRTTVVQIFKCYSVFAVNIM